MQSFLVVLGDLVDGRSGPLHGVGLAVAHLLYVLGVVLLEDHLSQLGRADVPVGPRLAHVFLRGREIVHEGSHPLGVLVAGVALLGLALDSDLDLPLQLHVGLDLGVDAEIPQTEHLLLVPGKPT